MRNPFIETTYAVAYRKIENKDYLFLTEEEKEYKIKKSSSRYWYADPILFFYNDELWLFVEKMDRYTRRGCISVAPVVNHEIGEFVDIINENFHLSYPMIFEKQGQIYMIPESTVGKVVNLYVCKEYPYKWEKIQTLFTDVLYADSNVIEYENHWYFITGEMDPKIGSKTKTLVYNAENIENGKLELLENNCFDFSYEDRGAGSIFKYDNKCIRPIQCGNEFEYGKSLKFESIDFKDNIIHSSCLSKVDTSRIKINDKRALFGTHTYGFFDDFEVIDVKFQEISNLGVIFSKIKRKLGLKQRFYE